MIRWCIIALVVSLCLATTAHADGTCTPSSTGLEFGSVPSGTAITAGSIVLTCTGSGTLNYTVKLGTGASGTIAPRQLRSGASLLDDNLYRDPARTQVWGDGTGGSTTVTGTVSLLQQRSASVTVPVYGKIAGQLAPGAGRYSDTIIVSVVTGLATSTGAMPVSATIQPSCTIAATDLLFGAYTGNQLDGQSQMSLSCTNGVPWSVGLSPGNWPGATAVTRRMAGPGSPMAYALFRDSARTLNWGNTVGVDTLSGTSTGTVQRIPVYGRVPAAQLLPPGNYHDTIVATVSF